MLSAMSRIVGITFAAAGLFVITLWFADGAPLPQTFDEIGQVASPETRFFIDIFVRGDAREAAKVAKTIKDDGYPAVDTLADTWDVYDHDFVILNTYGAKDILSVLAKLNRDIPGAVVGSSSTERWAYFWGDLRHGRYPFGKQLIMVIAQISAASARVVIYSVASFIVLVALLALWLLTRGAGSDAIRRLGLTLGCWALVLCYFYFISVVPTYGHYLLFPVIPRIGIDIIMFEILLFSVYAFANFWKIFPRPVTDEELHRFLQALKREQVQAMGAARRNWFGRGSRNTPKSSEQGDTMEIPYRPVTERLKIAMTGGVALLVGLCWTGAYLVPGQFASVMVLMVIALGALTIYYHLFFTPLRLFKYHRTVGSPEDQRKVEWVWVSMLMMLVTVVTPLFGLAVLYLGSYLIPALDSWINLGMVLTVIGFNIGPLMVVIALALSILYRGSLDPRLALRGFTVWTVMSVVLTLLFVFVERSVALKLVKWWDLPSQTGLVTAGAMVAATFQPIRKQIEKQVNRFVERSLPTTLLASGQRHLRAVAVTDISGYTALSARDEQAALLATTLLQREARRLADAHQGRVVKSTGDGVILSFETAQNCLDAVKALHVAVAASASALNLPGLNLHSGLNWGEVVEMHDGDIYGMTVNLAARIADWAKAGEIGASETFHSQLTDGNSGFESVGPQSFKNVPQALHCLKMAVG